MVRGLLQVFSSKVILAILGALLIGGVSAGLAAGTAIQPHAPTPGVASTTGGANTATATGATQATSASSPTATDTPTDTPTTAPQNNPTATPNGQVTLRGTIAAVPPTTSSNTFTMNVHGTSYTVLVDGNTNFTGNAQSIGDLKVGWTARVVAMVQPDGTTYLASDVNANPPGGD